MIAKGTFTSLALCLVFATANAAPLRWDIVEMIFDDGGTGSGSFIYDEDTGHVSEVLIKTTAGSTLTPGYTYLMANAHVPVIPGPSTGIAFVSLSGIPAAPVETILSLGFSPQLTNAGGMVDLLNDSFEAICEEHIWCFGPSVDAQRFLVSGSMKASVVPIPAAAWLFGSALGLLGWVTRKKVV